MEYKNDYYEEEIENIFDEELEYQYLKCGNGSKYIPPIDEDKRFFIKRWDLIRKII